MSSLLPGLYAGWSKLNRLLAYGHLKVNDGALPQELKSHAIYFQVFVSFLTIKNHRRKFTEKVWLFWNIMLHYDSVQFWQFTSVDRQCWRPIDQLLFQWLPFWSDNIHSTSFHFHSGPLPEWYRNWDLWTPVQYANLYIVCSLKLDR